MLPGEIGILALVASAYAAFIGVVGYFSFWSRKPAKRTAADSTTASTDRAVHTLRRVA